MTEVATRLAKARSEVNDLKNGAARAVYAIDRALEGLGSQPAPAPVVTPPVVTIPPMKGQLIKDDWNQPWAAAYWGKDALPWLFENAVLSNGEIRLNLTPKGGASIQSHTDQLSTNATFTVWATTDKATTGIIQSPLYLFGADYQKTQDEVDFEIVGDKGLILAVHRTGTSNVWTKTIPGDFTGRHKWEIIYQADDVIIWRVDDVEVARVTKAELGAKFPTAPLKPYIEIWPTRNEGWAGKFTPPVTMAMTIHGYRKS